jgi:hypothetical protein
MVRSAADAKNAQRTNAAIRSTDRVRIRNPPLSLRCLDRPDFRGRSFSN